MATVTLLYPPQQTLAGHSSKPEASLAYPYLAGALLEAGHEVKIYDAYVGNDGDPEGVFDRKEELPSGLTRHGVSDERILDEIADSDVVGITSIFTAQETMALRVCRLIKRVFPDKLVVAGGVNARSRYRKFCAAGCDAVCMSEGECYVLDVARNPGEYRNGLIPKQEVIVDLDELPMPAWELHPNQRYWSIARPHGASKPSPFRYAAMMTSRGCVFRCKYCHISTGGDIADFRTKSLFRIERELEKLKSLGVEHLYVEDDTLFGDKARGIAVLKHMRSFGFRLWGINGINLVHLFRKIQSTEKWEPDTEVLNLLAECQFEAITLPVESASQRIIDDYASRKWRISRLDVSSLIHELASRGIASGVNYMIGYPDETKEEIEATIEMAREHRAAGASSANFMLVVPFPGTRLHGEAIFRGYLDSNFNPDTFSWRRANMKNTAVPPEELERIRDAAYAELNGGV
ncbi:MAG: radical SAM protein [bacterium]